MTTKKLKPFSFEAAKAGAAVITREGHGVRILCFDSEIECDDIGYPIVALLPDYNGDESCQSFTSEGYYLHGDNNPEDLFMATVKRSGYLNIYPDGKLGYAVLYPSKDAADSAGSRHRVACVLVEWEE